MAVKVLELHHHGIRVGPSPEEVAKARKFYGDVLGLDHDPGRPNIPTIDGYWMDVGGTAQIHLMGVDGQSKFAKGPGQDPSLPHVALAVADIQETKQGAGPARRRVLGGRERGGTAVAADLHEGPVRQHDRAAPDRHVPVRDLAALGRPRRQDGVSEAARGRIVEIASRLAREQLAPRAARYDREAANPVESWRDLHADGILAAAMPGGPRWSRPRHADLRRGDPRRWRRAAPARR